MLKPDACEETAKIFDFYVDRNTPEASQDQQNVTTMSSVLELWRSYNPFKHGNKTGRPTTRIVWSTFVKL